MYVFSYFEAQNAGGAACAGKERHVARHGAGGGVEDDVVDVLHLYKVANSWQKSETDMLLSLWSFVLRSIRVHFTKAMNGHVLDLLRARTKQVMSFQ